MRLKILVADDHRLMLEAIRYALADNEDMVVVGEVDSGGDVLPSVRQLQPDVVLLDIRMPGMDGLRVLELLKEEHPGVKAIVLSAANDPQIVEAALARGAQSFIFKQIDPLDLVSAIRQAIDGSVYQVFAPTKGPRETADRNAGLTDRELSVIRALSSGLSNKQIAAELSLAEQTVKFHLTKIYRKLGIDSRTEAVRYAYSSGLVGNDALRLDEQSASLA